MDRMSLVEHPATLLAEATAACGDHLPAIIVTGGPVRLRLRGTDVPMVEALLARLHPALHVAQPSGAVEVQDIRVVLDTGLAQRLDQAIRSSAPALASKGDEPHRVHDGVHLVRKQAGAAADRSSGYLLWDQANPRASSIVLGDSGAAADTVLLRLVRGVAARVLLAAGWIALHAACVMTPAGAVCLLGGPRSGKTTALLHLLTGAAGPVALVANSLVFLSPDGPAEVCTLPSAIGLRSPTIALFPALNKLIGDAGVRVDAGRTSLPAPALAKAFGVQQSTGGPVTAFVDVTFRSAEPATWRVLDTHDGEAALVAAYLPDGLLDDPHEHARLTAEHTRRHHHRLRQCAESNVAARCETGTDTATVLGQGVADLLAQAAR